MTLTGTLIYCGVISLQTLLGSIIRGKPQQHISTCMLNCSCKWYLAFQYRFAWYSAWRKACSHGMKFDLHVLIKSSVKNQAYRNCQVSVDGERKSSLHTAAQGQKKLISNYSFAQGYRVLYFALCVTDVSLFKPHVNESQLKQLPFMACKTSSSDSPNPNIIDDFVKILGFTSFACFNTDNDWS